MRIACAIGASFLTLAACGDEAQTDYSAQNQDEFFAACTAPLSDSTLVTRICGCVFESAQRELAYERFVEIEDALVLDTTLPLDPAIASIMADCIVEEAEL